MRSLGGFILLAGIGVGLFVYLPAPVDGTLSLAQVQDALADRVSLAGSTALTVRTATPAPRRIELTVVEPRTRSFSPNVSLAGFALPAAPTASPAPTASDESAPGGGWQTVVTTSGAAVQSASLAPRDASTRYKLVTDIQQQLKRVGCYYGRIDGSWGLSTKDAMHTFTDRINAELPLDEPDYLLLTLLQSHGGKACGECPPGLALTNGRCVAQPIVAQSRPGDAAQTAAAATHEVLPWQTAANGAGKSAAAKPLFTPVATSIVSSEPLPGRMAIGGPIGGPGDLPPVDAANADPAYSAAKTSVGAPIGATALAATPASLTPHPASQRSASAERRSNSRGSSRSDGPGTPRYNLLLGLGGVY